MVGIFKKLFGSSGETMAADAPPDAIYNDVEIRAMPREEGSGQFRIAGSLTKHVDGAPVTRQFVRADLVQGRDEAKKATLAKAHTIIDQNGSALWSGDLSNPV